MAKTTHPGARGAPIGAILLVAGAGQKGPAAGSAGDGIAHGPEGLARWLLLAERRQEGLVGGPGRRYGRPFGSD